MEQLCKVDTTKPVFIIEADGLPVFMTAQQDAMDDAIEQLEAMTPAAELTVSHLWLN